MTQVDSHTKSFKGIQDCNETRYDNNNIEPHQAVEDKFMFYFYDYEETKTTKCRFSNLLSLPKLSSHKHKPSLAHNPSSHIKQFQLFKKQIIYYPSIESSELQRIINDKLKLQRICKLQV